MTCKLLKSDEYKNFRATIPLKKICVDDNIENEWNIYECGSKSSEIPIICLPPISGNADIFYKQLLTFSSSGFRILSVHYAVYWNCPEFCEGFKRLLDHLGISKVHLLGASLGGFLCQKFAEAYPGMIESMILCNTFDNTNIFDNSKAASTYWLYPLLLLQRIISKNLKGFTDDQNIQQSIEFALESLKTLSQKQLASRLALNCLESSVTPDLISHVPITIINTSDQSALCPRIQKGMTDKYPGARLVAMETGGNFPYLSRPEEFNEAVTFHLVNHKEEPIVTSLENLTT